MNIADTVQMGMDTICCSRKEVAWRHFEQIGLSGLCRELNLKFRSSRKASNYMAFHLITPIAKNFKDKWKKLH